MAQLPNNPLNSEPNYTCAQDELYEGCDLLATSLDEELAQLAAFKAKYDAQFVADFRTLIKQATDLPDDDQRVAAHEVLRIQMVKAVDTQVKTTLGSLRLYIRDAYQDEDERKVRLREAGYDDYEAAMKYNWEKLKGLLKNANDFITNHLGELTANNNMPPAFQATVTNMKTQADTAVTKLLNLRENSKQGTQDKIQTNNTLNTLRGSICEDGQHVFENNEAKRSQFVWDSILALISPPGKAALRFDVKENITNNPIQNAEAEIQKQGGTVIKATTDKEGKAFIDGLEPGTYKGKISHPDYVTLTVEFEITTGVTSFKHWLLIQKV